RSGERTELGELWRFGTFAKTVERAAQAVALPGLDRIEVDVGRIAAGGVVEVFANEVAAFCQRIRRNEQRVERERGTGGVGAVPGAGWPERHDLPETLA